MSRLIYSSRHRHRWFTDVSVYISPQSTKEPSGRLQGNRSSNNKIDLLGAASGGMTKNIYYTRHDLSQTKVGTRERLARWLEVSASNHYERIFSGILLEPKPIDSATV